MKKFLLILGIISGALVASLYLFVVSGAFAILVPNPPEPQIKYGEFPFTITYEINGGIKTYEDIQICEYAGVENLGTGGKDRKWKARSKNNDSGKIVLLQGTEGDSTFQLYEAIPGMPEYFMGDPSRWRSKEEYEGFLQGNGYFGYIQWHNGVETEISIEEEVVWEKYRIRVISVECAPPIENTFVDPETGAIVDYRGEPIGR
ncbi:MAG: hypothetical protein IKM21_04895 [Oscillospiraceae bacterium]|nr:hypothetical protein [Oscillospiraceae bacterium]